MSLSSGGEKGATKRKFRHEGALRRSESSDVQELVKYHSFGWLKFGFAVRTVKWGPRTLSLPQHTQSSPYEDRSVQAIDANFYKSQPKPWPSGLPVPVQKHIFFTSKTSVTPMSLLENSGEWTGIENTTWYLVRSGLRCTIEEYNTFYVVGAASSDPPRRLPKLPQEAPGNW
ncbi:hypothetical protein BDW75DRAFT_182289 [Aspergillus navahoensis]